jgi:hypothetical protein
MGLEGLLVLPHFHDREMTRSTALLQYLKTRLARIRSARVTVLPEQCGSLSCGRRHDFEI